MEQGLFIISLDFELMWGVRDKRTIRSYGANIRKVYDVIPKMLVLFKKYNVNVTFATVGMLFAANKKQLNDFLPNRKPSYSDVNLSPYTNEVLEAINEKNEPLFFCPELIKLIQSHSNHEISTHTFSHFYCLEDGQSNEEFKEDLIAAKAIAKLYNIETESIVFPRNQYEKEYLEICAEMGIQSFRGNENAWYYFPSKRKNENRLKRGFRLLDAYINLSGDNSFEILRSTLPINIPSSRFLRPYNKKLKFLEPLRMRRILNAMCQSAKDRKAFHLWWHPHNFGSNTEENFEILERILIQYKLLNEQYGFESKTMKEAKLLV